MTYNSSQSEISVHDQQPIFPLAQKECRTIYHGGKTGHDPYFLSRDLQRRDNWHDPVMQPGILIRMAEGARFLAEAQSYSNVSYNLGCVARNLCEKDGHPVSLFDLMLSLQKVRAHIALNDPLLATQSEINGLRKFFHTLGRLTNQSQ